MIKKEGVSVAIIIGLLGLAGCGEHTGWETLLAPKEILVIRAKKKVSGGTIELRPGTRVEFRDIIPFDIAGENRICGELILTDGAKLIAQGTKEEPIVFTAETFGSITFEESSDGENSIFEYCKFEENIFITCENSVTIQYCKFRESEVGVNKNSTSLIQYNNFEMTSPSFNNYAIRPEGGNPKPTVQYNNITKYDIGISLPGGSIIKYNNITNCERFAISMWPPGIAEGNYVANCNNKVGVDTTGEQSREVSYINPRVVPVQNAGCGW